jgi:hypothetical protein
MNDTSLPDSASQIGAAVRQADQPGRAAAQATEYTRQGGHI